MPAHNRIALAKGDKFNMLTVVEELPKKNGRVHFLCRCDCGEMTVVESYALRRGDTKSCGCLQRRRTSESNRTHGLSRTRLYRELLGMKRRCYKKTDPAYPRYGGRGIGICDKWRNSFEAFRSWALASGYADDLTIERVDNDKWYCPENCRWIPKSEQAKNRRMNITVTIEGKEMCLADAARHFGIVSPRLAQARVSQCGWDKMDALTTPAGATTRRLVTFRGETKTLTEWAEITGLAYDLICQRLSPAKGWSVERALTTPNTRTSHERQKATKQKHRS